MLSLGQIQRLPRRVVLEISREMPGVGAPGKVLFPLMLAFVMVLASGARQPARADALTPLAAVRGAIDQTVGVLHDQAAPLEERRRDLRQLAESNLDLAQMARVALGPHWEQLSEAQRAEFVPLFAAFIESAYLDQIQDYARLRIDVSTQSLSDPQHARVSATVVQPDEAPLPITFMLERAGNRWLVYDVAVGDISMVGNYRQQFDRVIRSRGVDELMARLKQKQARLTALLGQPAVSSKH